MIPDKRNGSTIESELSCNLKTCIAFKNERIIKCSNGSVIIHKPVESLQNQTTNESSEKKIYLDSDEENVMTKTDYDDDINNFSPPQNAVIQSGTNDESNDESESPIPQDVVKVVDNECDDKENNNNDDPSIPNDEVVNEDNAEMDVAQFESTEKLQGNNAEDLPEHDPNEIHPSKVPCQRPSCRGPTCDRYKVKRKLEECDKSIDYLLMEGPVYVRRSLIEGTDEESSKKPAQSILNRTEDSGMGLEDCKKCCLQQNYCAKYVLKACDSDIEAIVKAYQPKYERNGGEKNNFFEDEPTEDSMFYMQLTHGEADGDDKYHYLMVDTTTSYSSNDFKEQQPIKKPLTPIIMSHQEKHLDVEPPRFETTTKASTSQIGGDMSFNLTIVQPSENFQTDFEDIVAEIKKTSSHVEIHSEEKKETPENETKEIETVTEQLDKVVDTDIVEQAETPPEERRTSILWNRNVDPSRTNSTDEEQPEGGRERRVSAVSWRSVEPDPSASNEAAAITDSLQRIADEATMRSEKTRRGTQQSGRQTSVFQDIIREEKRKSNSKKGMAVIPDNILKKSIVTAKLPPIQIKKARCCGLIKPKIKRDKSAVEIIEDTDNELNNEDEMSNSDSNRSSINSYRRRSSSIDNPVSEKKKEINKYLNNV